MESPFRLRPPVDEEDELAGEAGVFAPASGVEAAVRRICISLLADISWLGRDTDDSWSVTKV